MRIHHAITRIAALLWLGLASMMPALAQSTINPGVPATDADLHALPVRQQFLAAATDINHILGMFAGSSAPSTPVTFQLFANTSVSPYQLNIFDGTVQVPWGFLDPVAHTFSPSFNPAGFHGTSPIVVSSIMGVITTSLNTAATFPWLATQIINLNSSTATPAAKTGTTLNIAQADGVVNRIQLSSYGGVLNVLSGVAYGGTKASPTAPANGTEVSSLNAYEYNGTAVVGPIAAFRTYVSANTDQSSTACIATTPTASTTLTNGLCQQSDGSINVGGATGSFTGPGTVDVAGGYYINGVAVVSLPGSAVNGQLLQGVTSSNPIWSSTPTLGIAGTTVGTLSFANATSGSIKLQPATGALGTSVLTLPALTSTLAVTGNNLGVFAATTSAQLASVLSDETGTGAAVFGTSPTIATPTISSPAISNPTFSGTVAGAGTIPNSVLANSSITVNGTSCTLGASCTPTSAATSIAVGTTTVTSGTAKGLLYNNAGALGNLASAANGVLVTDASSNPSIAATLPAVSGGTGVSNSATITVGGAFSTSAALAITAGTGGQLAIWGSGTLLGTNIASVLTAGTNIAITGSTNATIGITGQIALANGGSAANLTASNGGIVYSTASAMAILAGTSTANLCLLSGASTAPSWGSCSSGGGGVTGPGSAVSGNVASFNGTSGSLIQDSGVLASNIALLTGSTFTGAVTFSNQVTHNVARTIATSSGANLDDLNFQAATTTLTGTATVNKLNKASFYQPTFTDASAGTILNASTVYIDNAPVCAGALTCTNLWAFRVVNGNTSIEAPLVFNIQRIIASATAAVLDDISVTGGTTTITGNTGSPITQLNKFAIYGPTFSDSSAVTVTNAATFYVSAAPNCGGSVTCTNKWSIFVGSGASLLAATNVSAQSASAFMVGNGLTNPVFNVDTSGTTATGINIKGAVAGSGVAMSVLSSGTNENVTFDAKGSGTITLGSVSTGAITLTRATTISAALTYGGVTLSNAVTGTGNMVLSANQTFTGTLTAATIAASGVISTSNTTASTSTTTGSATFGGGGGFVGQVSANNFASAALPTASVATVDSSLNGGFSVTGSTGSSAVIAKQFPGAMVLVRCDTGDIALYLIDSGTALLGSSGFVASTTTPASGKSSIAYDGSSGFRIYNNTGTTRLYNVMVLKTE